MSTKHVIIFYGNSRKSNHLFFLAFLLEIVGEEVLNKFNLFDTFVE